VKKIFFSFIFVTALLFCLSEIISFKAAKMKIPASPIARSAAKKLEDKVNPYIGEKITYEIRLLNLKIGSAILSCLPSLEVDGKPADQIVFETTLSHFKDIEVIFSDPQTFLPVRVERSVLNWFSEENIIEKYDQKNFTVTITKRKGNKSQSLVIRKDAPVHNAILLTQYVRTAADLFAGRAMTVNLPGRKLEIKLLDSEEITVPAGSFKAYHFVSSPRQIEIWISMDAARIPLKIQGVGKIGYLMVLKRYTKS
jgi:hypothetical protein